VTGKTGSKEVFYSTGLRVQARDVTRNRGYLGRPRDDDALRSLGTLKR
jgi:hypothetical protein